MRGIGLVWRAELFRLVRSRAAWIVFALVVLLSAARAYTSVVLASQDVVQFESGGAWGPFIDGWRLGLALSAAVALVGGALTLAGDLESGCARLSLTRSAGRGALLIGRGLLAPFVALPLAAGAAFGAYMVAANGLDFGALVEEGYEIMPVLDVRREVSIALQSVLPGLAGMWILGLAVATVSRSAAWAVALSLGGWLAFDQFKPDLLREKALFIFPSHVPSAEDTSAFDALKDFVRGASDTLPAEEHLALARFAAALGVVVLLILAWLILRKKRI